MSTRIGAAGAEMEGAGDRESGRVTSAEGLKDDVL